jgi:hypothetical protein
LVSNALDLAVLNSVGDFILFLGKCFVTAATGSVGLVIMKQNPHLHFYAIPTLIVCIFAYFIAHSVLTLYEVRNRNRNCVSVVILMAFKWCSLNFILMIRHGNVRLANCVAHMEEKEVCVKF